MTGFHLEIVDIVLAGVAVVSGFAARLWWQSLSRNPEWQARRMASPDSARAILLAAIAAGVIAGGSAFLGGFILPLRGNRTLQEFALETVVIGVLVAVGAAVGHLLASLLLHRGRPRGQS